MIHPQDKLDDIYFTERQWAYLEKVFPEKIPTHTTQESQLWIQAGCRQVVHHIKGKVR